MEDKERLMQEVIRQVLARLGTEGANGAGTSQFGFDSVDAAVARVRRLRKAGSGISPSHSASVS